MWRKIIERLENCPPSFPPALLWGNVFKIAQYQPFFWRRWWIFIAFKIQIRSAYSFISRIRNFQLGRNNLQPFHSNNMDNAEKWLDGGEKNKTKERKWFRLCTIFWKLKLDTCGRREFLIFLPLSQFILVNCAGAVASSEIFKGKDRVSNLLLRDRNNCLKGFFFSFDGIQCLWVGLRFPSFHLVRHCAREWEKK